LSEPNLLANRTKMVDNAWRDSFIVNVNKSRLPRESDAAEREDNSTLLELERKIHQAKPTGGDGLFAGTSFEAPESGGPTNLIKNGLSISASKDNSSGLGFEPISEEQEREEADALGKRESKRVTIYNRATAVLEDFADRLSSSGGGIVRRKSKEDLMDREKSTDGDRRRSTAPQRVKSVVSKLQKATSRRKTKTEVPDNDVDPQMEVADSVLHAENPNFKPPQAL